MKIYDKEIYNRQKSISSIVTILIAFFIGFACGYLTNTATEKNHNTIENNTSIVNNTVNTLNENKTMEE